MKWSPTKKKRPVGHVWWWPRLLLKASFNCPLQRLFFRQCKTVTSLLFHTLSRKDISHNVCYRSQCPFLSLWHTHTLRGLPNQHTSTHTQPHHHYTLRTLRWTHIPHRSAHIYTDRLRIKTVVTHTNTVLYCSLRDTAWPDVQLLHAAGVMSGLHAADDLRCLIHERFASFNSCTLAKYFHVMLFFTTSR